MFSRVVAMILLAIVRCVFFVFFQIQLCCSGQVQTGVRWSLVFVCSFFYRILMQQLLALALTARTCVGAGGVF